MRALKIKQAGWAGFCALIISTGVRANPALLPAPLMGALLAADEDGGGGADAGSSFDNLDIVDASLNGKLAVLRVGSQLAENNLLSVFAGLRNKTGHRLALEVETIYKDNAGNALNAGSWIPLTLKPYEEKDYRSSSISVDAVDFLIRVRHAVPSKKTSA